MYITGKNYKESKELVIELPTEEEIKEKIKSLIPDNGKKEYKEVIDEVEQAFVAEGKHLKTDKILECVKAVDLEWHPKVEDGVEIK